MTDKFCESNCNSKQLNYQFEIDIKDLLGMLKEEFVEGSFRMKKKLRDEILLTRFFCICHLMIYQRTI